MHNSGQPQYLCKGIRLRKASARLRSARAKESGTRWPARVILKEEHNAFAKAHKVTSEASQGRTSMCLGNALSDQAAALGALNDEPATDEGATVPPRTIGESNSCKGTKLRVLGEVGTGNVGGKIEKNVGRSSSLKCTMK